MEIWRRKNTTHLQKIFLASTSPQSKNDWESAVKCQVTRVMKQYWVNLTTNKMLD